MKKNILVVFSFLFLIIISNVSYGQFGGVPVTTTIKTPYGNVPHTYYVPSPQHYYGQQNVSTKYEFNIILKNDSTIKEKTRINLSKDEDNSLTIKHKGTKQEIFPNDTKSIFRITFEGVKLTGIPADSCWLFKTAPGKINGYSFLAEVGMMYVIAIQQGFDGPIVPLTKDNLLPMVSTNPKAAKLAEKNKLHKAITLFNEESSKQTKFPGK